MSERLLGIETEYGLSARRGGAVVPERGSCADDLLQLAAQRHQSLPAYNGTGIFLTSGARFYIDSGEHPEFCTPEVNNPWDVVRYVQAGDELLYGLASELATRRNGPEPVMFKCNVDYVSGETWACHENYGHQANPDALPNQIIPHLVSRIIYTGAGGLNPFAHGIEFCLSPRVHHLETITSTTSTSARGIYHLKDETLSSRGWHRLHILCGESLCSQLGAWLKIGTTALVVALVEAGLRPGEAVQFREPLDAMRCFNADPSCEATARLTDGRFITALAVQRHYLAFVEKHREHPCLPEWTAPVCQAWRDILSRLERGPAAVSTRLDWAMKRALYLDHVNQRGVKPDQLATLNQALASPRPRLPHRRTSSVLAMLSDAGVITAQPSHSLPPTESAGVSGGQPREFLKLRSELCELDVRFGQLGPEGIFAALDRAGLLQHRLPEISPQSVRDAVCEPPAAGRARLRGQVVKTFAGRSGYQCDWSGVRSGHGEVLDLSNPLQQEMPKWTKRELDPDLPPTDGVGQLLEFASHEFDRGNYDRARAHLDLIASAFFGRTRPSHPRLLELMAWVQSRRGFFPEALAALEEIAAVHPMSFHLASQFVAVHRFQGLAPGTAIWEWIRRAEELLAQNSRAEPAVAFGFLAHKGCALMHCGRLTEARTVLQRVAEEGERGNGNPRLFARALADLADVHRQLADFDNARQCLDVAEEVQTGGEFLGDLADFTLLNRVKLDPADSRVRVLLDRAQAIQTNANNRLGLARTWLLEARLFPNAAQGRGSRQLLREQQSQLPSLQGCPLFEKILSHWDDWCGGQTPSTEKDRFWGL